MITNFWNSNNEAARLFVTIKTNGSKRIRIVAEDYNRANSKYADRVFTVNGSRTIFLSFPVSPKQIALNIMNVKDNSDKDIQVTYDKRPINAANLWMDAETIDFVQTCLLFSQTMGFTPAPKWYLSHDQYFKIKMLPVIVDYMSGQTLSTPARIGHDSGVIEASQARMLNYTVAARVAIMLHEFSHKYKNPKLGLPIDDETGADINALYIYLGLGFSKVDAIYVYCNVFLKAQTEGNQQRIRAIMDYIEKYEKGILQNPKNVLT